MPRNSLQFDRPFFIIVSLLVVAGFLIFLSASMGLMAREGPKIGSLILNQSTGLLLGIIVLFGTSHIHYKVWKKYTFYIFITAVSVNLLVFIPGLGFTHNGATRWIDLGLFTIQPSELLKIAFIIFLATWLSNVKEKIKDLKFGLFPFIILIGIVGIIALLQSDTDVLVSVFISGLAMLFIAGIRWRDLGILILFCILGLGLLAFSRPYVLDRIETFLNPTADSQGSSYQLQQSLIAVGSGGLFGNGFGQSIQKFGFLPEPIGDSIFPVYAEEFGFVGTLALVILLVLFATRGLKIASKSPDFFGTLLVTGIIVYIISQCFMNISAMVGLMPLSGMPLLFISHGSTALIFTMAEVGIILNISKF